LPAILFFVILVAQLRQNKAGIWYRRVIKIIQGGQSTLKNLALLLTDIYQGDPYRHLESIVLDQKALIGKKTSFLGIHAKAFLKTYDI